MITEPGGASRVLWPACEGGEAINLAFLADDQEQEKRRKSSFALDDKIWDLEDQKDARDRIAQASKSN